MNNPDNIQSEPVKHESKPILTLDTYQVSWYESPSRNQKEVVERKVVVHCVQCRQAILKIGSPNQHFLHGWKIEMDGAGKCITLHGTCRKCFQQHRITLRSLLDYMALMGRGVEYSRGELESLLNQLNDKNPFRLKGDFPYDSLIDAVVLGFEMMLKRVLFGSKPEEASWFKDAPDEFDAGYWDSLRTVRLDFYMRMANFGLPLPKRSLLGFISQHEEIFRKDTRFYIALMKTYKHRTDVERIVLRPATKRLEKKELRDVFRLL